MQLEPYTLPLKQKEGLSFRFGHIEESFLVCALQCAPVLDQPGHLAGGGDHISVARCVLYSGRGYREDDEDYFIGGGWSDFHRWEGQEREIICCLYCLQEYGARANVDRLEGWQQVGLSKD